jgi:hypothetical protein
MSELIYKEAYKHEAWGTPTLGVKILVSCPHEFTDVDKMAFQKADDMIFKALDKSFMLQNDDSIEGGKEAKAKLLGLFEGPIFVEEIPNGYCSQACCIHYPWFIVTTKIGHIMIGWRKRVINIDWSKTTVKQTANDLFPNEDVTKIGHSIHAWGYEKAKIYLDILHKAKNELETNKS